MMVLEYDFPFGVTYLFFDTLPKTNSSENGWVEDDRFPFWEGLSLRGYVSVD